MGLMSAKTAGEKRDVAQRCASACAEGRTPAGHTFGVSDGAKKPGGTSAAQIGVPKVRPFLKWAGGKGQLLTEIEKYYPCLLYTSRCV